MANSSLQEAHLSLARASLRQALTHYSYVRQGVKTPNPELEADLQTQLDILESSLKKLDHNAIRIAVFGLVSRGKSAVLNALLGQKILQTGPLNGVTQWPRSVRWTVSQLQGESGGIQVELIDTPGLDEVGGEVRGEMAKEVTRQADLILFVVSGDITRTEYEALVELRKAQKPLILVFNKIDLYPEVDREAIYQSLQTLAKGELSNTGREEKIPSDEIVMVAAEPASIQVRVEWPDGRVTYESESPPPLVDELKEAIVDILNREGRSLLAINALIEARNAEAAIARKIVKLQQTEADTLIWQFAKYKALAIGLNPVAFLDIVGSAVADLALIRSLAKLYNLPVTNHEAAKLWKTILLSAGGILLGELGSGILLGLGKSAAGLGADFSTFAGVAVTQASLAAYGAYAVGRSAQVYLEKGCTWGPLGQDRVIEEILNQVDRDAILFRLRQEI